MKWHVTAQGQRLQQGTWILFLQNKNIFHSKIPLSSEELIIEMQEKEKKKLHLRRDNSHQGTT